MLGFKRLQNARTRKGFESKFTWLETETHTVPGSYQSHSWIKNVVDWKLHFSPNSKTDVMALNHEVQRASGMTTYWRNTKPALTLHLHTPRWRPRHQLPDVKKGDKWVNSFTPGRWGWASFLKCVCLYRLNHQGILFCAMEKEREGGKKERHNKADVWINEGKEICPVKPVIELQPASPPPVSTLLGFMTFRDLSNLVSPKLNLPLTLPHRTMVRKGGWFMMISKRG